MKRLLLQIIAMSVLFSSVYAQSITFDRTLPSFEFGYDYGLFSIPSRDNGYIVCGCKYYHSKSNYIYYGSEGIVVFKVDKNGFLQWYSTIASDSTFYKPIQCATETTTGSIVAVGTRKHNGIESIYSIKFNAVGDTLWEKIYSGNKNLFGCAVMESSDGNYLLLGANFNIMQLIKTDTDGNIIWEKEYNGPGYFSGNCMNISGWGDGYAVSDDENIIKIDTAGNELFSVAFKSNIIKERYDGSIAAAGWRNLRIYDPIGNLILNRNFNEFDEIQSFIFSDNNSIIFFSSGNLVKIDTYGHILWQMQTPGGFNSAVLTNDDDFLFTGSRENLVHELKTDSLLNYSGIDFYSFGNPVIHVLQPVKLQWYSSNVDYVDISYSTNNGSTWNVIASNVASGSKNDYAWNPQNEINSRESSQLIIKINDSAYPQIFDRSDIPLKVKSGINFPYYDKFAANEISMWVGNNGSGSHNPNTNGQGLLWPGGKNATKGAVFEDGLVWGGKINGKIHVGGSTYHHGQIAGRILPNGLPSDSNNIESKIFKIVSNKKTLTNISEKGRLNYDYENWPGDIGAPYFDLNKDGQYTPGIDKPMLLGDETMWYVSNDLDTAACRYLYGSDPMGLEIQTTIFGYNTVELKNTVFKKYVIINKGQNTIDSMILAYWADDDVGDANDDYVGCDTALNLGYTYNGTNHDIVYGDAPPAIGRLIIQGPIVPAPTSDSARYEYGWKKGFKNLPMSAFVYYINGSTIYRDPVLDNYQGTIETYNQMRGLVWEGSAMIDPTTGNKTRFALDGNPIALTGWYEGWDWWAPPTGGPGERRYLISSGSFTLAPGDTQEVVIAVFLARGTNNVNSLAKLKQEALTLQNFYNKDLVDILNNQQVLAPSDYKLYQNYPNPFNTSTTIEYELPKTSNVEINVYDILGRLVKTLVNERGQVRYRYKVSFDGSKYASGVYFYRLQAGNFVQTKKMILLK